MPWCFPERPLKTGSTILSKKYISEMDLLVTEGTIEEGMLSTLSSKKDLFLAALDPDSTVREVSLTGSI
jgi:hypothetical protein